MMWYSERKVRSAAAERARRAGFVLPFVVVATALVAVLALAAISTIWRGYRATRLAANGVRAQFAADEGAALQLDAWPSESLASMPPGATLSTRQTTAVGDSVRVRVTRTQPLVAWLTADVALEPRGTPGVVRRHVTRAVSLEPPALPIVGAVTAIAAVRGQDPTTIDGRDLVDAGDACGPLRDTLSLVPVASSALGASSGGAWTARPATSALVDTATVRAAFDLAWISVMARSPVRAVDSTPQLLAASPGWHALLLDGAVVTVRAPSRWRGLLAVSGDLVVTGSLTVDGILVVRGRLDARGAALRIRGALIVASLGNPSVELGDQTTLRYDRCAVQLALATVAVPRAQPFSLWFSPLN
ncbi:hypothetical protein [Gemmatimonas groenlandica]|uniref:Uncharacterized protein n=1 Tax=Gemmatimonas groenlandica TaxID=2732249 RepID=A0A6M4II98_9BACT|nr:hypothetical protein [Gemmatimonas groenlandica]QJR34350.1 hypothetical protein HKW67_01830 [Gemmatimonas groenlandica]